MGQIVVNVHRSDGINIPNTGTLTYTPQTILNNDDNSINGYYFGLGIVLTILLIIVVPIIVIKRKSLNNNNDTLKFSQFFKKKLLPRLFILALFSCAITFSVLAIIRTNTNNSTATNQTTFGDALNGASGDIAIDVEVGDEPTFVYVPSTITIAEATEGGYDLSAYTTNTDLVSETGDKILSLSSTEATALNENTWGISLSIPESQISKTWLSIPADKNNPLLLKETTATTPANDTVTIYYGVYITPDLPEGTYTGTINYNTTANLVMQNVAEWGDTVTTGQEVFAVDKRDGRKYSVARLKDGKLWMGENLDLGRTALTTDLTSENTNLKDTITAETFNGWRKTSSTKTYNDGELINVSGADEVSGTSYGTLYNYYAASAGTVSGNANGNSAQYDICPAGWRLPTGRITGEFNTLYSYYNSPDLMRASINEGGAAFTLAGEFGFNENVSELQSVAGYYWSSNRHDDWNMSFLIVSTSVVYPYNGANRRYGYAIRCVLDAHPIISDLTYMQDFKDLSERDKESVLNSMEDSTVYNLIDNRDNKSYQIAKLKDGNIWMAENLDLGRTELTADLTSENTNLSETITAEAFNSWKKPAVGLLLNDGEFTSINGIDEISGTPYGTLYNYYVTSAKTISGDIVISNAKYDICPAGWRLPTGNTSGETAHLYENYNSATLIRTPINEGGAAIALSGVSLENKIIMQGGSGHYWTSTGQTDKEFYNLAVDSSEIRTHGVVTRSVAISIRCIVK